jgi:MFS family permease
MLPAIRHESRADHATPIEAAAIVSNTPLPLVIYVLAAGTFLMGTTEFVVAGLLPEMAADFGTSVAHAGLAITVFAVGMIVGARRPRSSTSARRSERGSRGSPSHPTSTPSGHRSWASRSPC